MKHVPDVVVVGAGVVGISCALELQKRGLDVTVFERDRVAAGASFGNAGAFAFSDIIPLASPGIVVKAPKWLIAPTGPLSIPPRYALQILPWLAKFWRSSWRDRFHSSVSAQASLMTYSRSKLLELIVDVEAHHFLRQDGQLQLYEGQVEMDAAKAHWDLRAQHAVSFQELSSHDEITEVQPGLSPRFTHACFTPDWWSVSDPAKYTAYLARMFVERGGQINIANVTGFAEHKCGVRVISESAHVTCKNVVVAAGAWSRQLARTLGHDVPLETERGYNTTLPDRAIDLRTQLTFPNHGFVITRIGEGVRVGGAVELGGLTLPPNFARARSMLTKAKQFLPLLDTNNGKQWMGHRPSMPDSLPVIGKANSSEKVVFAFGHGHLGLTQAAGTATLTADLVMNVRPEIDLSPFRPDRSFNWV